MFVSHKWLQDYLGGGAPDAAGAADLLATHAFEIEGTEKVGEDTVIEVDILPNRSSDCLCHRGIARELASITGTPLARDPLTEPVDLPQTERIAVEIEDEDACPRFTASLIEGVTVKESPAWLRERLSAIGVRPINNIVDATNYVMYAIGQPLHAYDADRFPQKDGVWRFSVRYAKTGEVVSLIAEGGKDEARDIELEGTELLITDTSTGAPVGLAGVKGGRYAGIHEGTTNVIIEAAHFDPALTRRTARRLGIVIDASKRFENEPSRELPPYAQRETAELVRKIAGGACRGMVDAYPKPREETVVTVRPERVNAMLGLSLQKEEMRAVLERIGARVTERDSAFEAVGPWERTDLTIEEDFIEEIGRIHGYEHITGVVPKAVPLVEVNKNHYYGELVRGALIEQGFSEVITSTFRKEDEVKLLNALASDKGCVRSSLRENIAEVLERNIQYVDLLGIPDVRVFEIGTVFTKTKEGISGHLSLCLGVRTKQTGYTKKDDPKLLDAVAAVEKMLGVPLQGKQEDGTYECDLSALIETLPAPAAYEPVAVSGEVQYRPFSPYPHVARDIALGVGAGTAAEEVEQLLNEHAGPLRVRTTLFDEFHKDDRISYAFRLVFQSHEKTLTDGEVNTIMDGIYKAVAAKGWEVR